MSCQLLKFATKNGNWQSRSLKFDEDFSEEMLADKHRERLLDIIRQKIEGQKVVVTETKRPAKVVDLMEALKQSLELTAQKKPVARAGESAFHEDLLQRKRA